MYKLGPDGLSGNDDCGQMSAWLVWTALGMYPMNPASGEYVFGYPLVDKAMLQLPNGKTLKIEVKKLKSGAKGIQKVLFNGRLLKTFVKHQELLKGGTIQYYIVE